MHPLSIRAGIIDAANLINLHTSPLTSLQEDSDEEGEGQTTVVQASSLPTVKQEPEEQAAHVPGIQHQPAQPTAVQQGEQAPAQQCDPPNQQGMSVGGQGEDFELVPRLPQWHSSTELLVPIDRGTAEQLSSIRLEVGGVMLAPNITARWQHKFDNDRGALLVKVGQTIKQWLPAECFKPSRVLKHVHANSNVLVLHVSWPLSRSGQTVGWHVLHVCETLCGKDMSVQGSSDVSHVQPILAIMPFAAVAQSSRKLNMCCFLWICRGALTQLTLERCWAGWPHIPVREGWSSAAICWQTFSYWIPTAHCHTPSTACSALRWTSN
jgi:hypothetical protein